MTYEAFIAYLERLADDEHPNRAALAMLRRGVGARWGNSGTYKHVVPFLPEKDEGVYPNFFLVAGLFGLHPMSSRKGNIGTVLRMMWNEGTEKSLERLFKVLVESHREELPAHLRRVVQMAKSHKPSVPVNYLQLIRDLQNWSRPDRRVQFEWAREFHKRSVETDAENEYKKGEQNEK